MRVIFFMRQNGEVHHNDQRGVVREAVVDPEILGQSLVHAIATVVDGVRVREANPEVSVRIDVVDRKSSKLTKLFGNKSFFILLQF